MRCNVRQYICSCLGYVLENRFTAPSQRYLYLYTDGVVFCRNVRAASMCGAFYIKNVDEMRPNFGPFAGVGISANPEHLPAPLELRCAVYISFFPPYFCSIVCFCVFVSRRRHELSDRPLPRINRDTWFAKPRSARIHAGTLFLYQIYRKTFFQHGTIVDAYNAPTKKNIYIVVTQKLICGFSKCAPCKTFSNISRVLCCSCAMCI